MFYLSLLEQSLRLPPYLLNLPLLDAIRGELERSFLDKVVQNLGLCVSVYDIKSIEGGIIMPGDGCPNYKVLFRLVMFRPFIGEVILGKVEDCNKNGLHVSLGFFSDVHIPVHHFPQPSTFDTKFGTWTWKASEDIELVLAKKEEIRFRVVSIKYPPIPANLEESDKPFAPMVIIGSIDIEGLGGTSWW